MIMGLHINALAVAVLKKASHYLMQVTANKLWRQVGETFNPPKYYCYLLMRMTVLLKVKLFSG